MRVSGGAFWARLGARWSTVGGAANAESGSVKWGERFAFGTEQIKNEAVTPAKAGAH